MKKSSLEVGGFVTGVTLTCYPLLYSPPIPSLFFFLFLTLLVFVMLLVDSVTKRPLAITIHILKTRKIPQKRKHRMVQGQRKGAMTLAVTVKLKVTVASKGVARRRTAS